MYAINIYISNELSKQKLTDAFFSLPPSSLFVFVTEREQNGRHVMRPQLLGRMSLYRDMQIRVQFPLRGEWSRCYKKADLLLATGPPFHGELFGVISAPQSIPPGRVVLLRIGDVALLRRRHERRDYFGRTLRTLLT